MKCWVCKRQARGYGHTHSRCGLSDPGRYPIDWVFCSRRCQNAFHALYLNWLRVQDGTQNPKEVTMIDPSDIELAALRKCLKAFGEAAGEIGFDKPLGHYGEPEAMQVIDAIVTCYTEAMVEHHEATRFPPVRGLAPAADPMANALGVSPSHPFSHMADDRPWDEPGGAKR